MTGADAMTALPDLARDLYQPTEQKALIFYVVFGQFGLKLELSASRFRSAGIPPGCELTLLTRLKHNDYISSLCEGYIWNELCRQQPELARHAEIAPTCVALKGEIDDPPMLNYFRDTVGVLACLLTQGGSVLYDPLQFRWWSPETWNREVFAAPELQFNKHVVILTSEEGAAGTTWVHTRGLRKFARPDISVHHVGQTYLPVVIDLCDRFIHFQGRGGVINEGQKVRVKALPSGGIARHGGTLDDPDFNNLHVEIVWPEGALAR